MHRERIRMRDMVVLLPGITGSVLQKAGKDFWKPSLWPILGAAITLGKNLAKMNMYWDDPDVDDLGDQIKATGLIQDAVIVPGLVKIDGYTKISEMILGCFDTTLGSLNPEDKPYPPANYFEFPYDWRRDNRLAARWLRNLIDLRLPQWQEYAGGEAKVILLAHSMGGIVARHYLEVMGGWEKCRALITFGTPYRGSINALDYLANGCRKYCFDLTETMSSFTSVYQLLPIYKAVNTDDGWQRVTEVKIERVDEKKAKEALAFHHKIMEHVDARPKGVYPPYLIYPVVGTYQPTLQSADFYDDVLTVSDVLPPGVDALLAHGDGTVPYASAIPHELSNVHRNSFFAESHGTIQCNDGILDFVYDQLQDLQVKGLEDLRGPRYSPGRQKRAAISLSVKDLYEAGEPVVVRARILEDGRDLTDFDKYRKHMESLLAVFELADRRLPPVTVTFTQQDHEWVLAQEGLPPGLYRLEVRTAKSGALAPPPVHDLFQVGAATEISTPL